jgi:uncharacterized BrkB/YihY/UPF0761 family membrane protein
MGLRGAVGAVRGRVEEGRARVAESRSRVPALDVSLSTVERDHARGGGFIAGALAYRLFFWLLPVALLVVAGLGFLSAADKSAPRDLAEEVGSFGFAAREVADASAHAEKGRFWALAVGLPALYVTSVSFVKALFVGSSLLWDIPLQRPRRKAVAALVMIGLLLALIAVLVLEGWVRRRAPGRGLVAALAYMVAIGAAWLLVTWLLPRPPGTGWRTLLPGAILLGIGIEGVHLVTVYYVARRLDEASELYGGLGTATALLLSLFLVARVAVLSLSLDAELWDRHR